MGKSIINIIISIIRNVFIRTDICYIVEDIDWSIKYDGIMIMSNLRRLKGKITMTHLCIHNSIIHFGSFNTFFSEERIRLPHHSNKIVVTVFHIPQDDKRVKLIPEAIEHVNLWHTSCTLTRDKLIKLGVPKEKIVVIPLGVNLEVFKTIEVAEKEEVSRQLNIPKDRAVIGSFQKDGAGWGDGLVPKLIKGPDIFCDVIERLSKEINIFVVLTGPARGYVKKRLKKVGVPYIHNFVKNPDGVAKYYNVLDLYLVTSREEGGPKAILESMASSVPIVSTKVGMAPDIISNGENGYLAEVDDVDMLYKEVLTLIQDKDLAIKFKMNGKKIAKNYDWQYIASRYQKKLYNKLI